MPLNNWRWKLLVNEIKVNQATPNGGKENPIWRMDSFEYMERACNIYKYYVNNPTLSICIH